MCAAALSSLLLRCGSSGDLECAVGGERKGQGAKAIGNIILITPKRAHKYHVTR